MNKYFKYVKPHLAFFVLAPVCMLTEVFGDVMLPKFLSLIINNGVVTGDTAYVIKTGIYMICFALVMMMGGIMGTFCASNASIRFAADLRQDMFNKIQGFAFEDIDEFSTGSLVTRLTNDVTQIQQCIRMLLIIALRSPGMLIGALIMACSINLRLALVIAAVIPVLIFAIAVILKTAFPRFNKMQVKIDNINSSTQENITNMRVIKSFLRTDHEIDKFKKANEDLSETTLRAMKVVILNMPVVTLIMNMTTIAVVWVGGNFVITGNMPIGDLSAFTIYIVQILMSLMMLSHVFLLFSRAVACVKRIGEILDRDVQLNDNDIKTNSNLVTRGEIEFKNVSFRYNQTNDDHILKDINIKIEAGSTVGIIGMTGSGKTSFVSLIPRLYDVTEGQVLVDGVDVRDYKLSELRQSVAMVLQNNVLFSGTIKENLKWGDESATEEQMDQACELAQISSYIDSLKDGYETNIEQGGTNLSGGQKQRLSIARALLKKPKILILDDSTSAVDTATENKIRQSFKTTLKETTKLIIAQRIQSVKDSHMIIVFENGMIKGYGTHKQLMENCDLYKEIYYSQMDNDES